MHDVKSYYLKSNNLNTEEQPAIVPKKGSKDSLADGQPDGFYVIAQHVGMGGFTALSLQINNSQQVQLFD